MQRDVLAKNSGSKRSLKRAPSVAALLWCSTIEINAAEFFGNVSGGRWGHFIDADLDRFRR